MDAVDINYALRKCGKTQVQIAADLGVAHATVNNTIHNRITCFAVASHIAKLLGQSVETLFPGRYQFKPRTKRSHIDRLAPADAGKED